LTYKLLMTSNYQDWATPQTLVNWLEDEFDIWFDWDVCASNDTAKCLKWYTAEDNALAKNWSNTCWMNPPYSEQKTWIDKAIEATQDGDAEVWALIPARTDTKLFHDIIMPNARDIYFIKGRIKFTRSNRIDDTCSTHPSMLVVFSEPIRQRRGAKMHTLDVPIAIRRGE